MYHVRCVGQFDVLEIVEWTGYAAEVGLRLRTSID